jgi:glycosyltransferase involved in cell wall biosynthesis
MRIAEIAPPYLTVPPDGYGGIELIVALLADGLVQRGHDVTLFASPGSNTRARLRSTLEQTPGPDALDRKEYALVHAADAYRHRHEFDLVHDHTIEGVSLAASLGAGPPVVHTLHGPWDDPARTFFSSVHDRVHLVAISPTQRSIYREVRYAGVVPNAIDVESYPYCTAKEDRLVFIGRCTPDKGPTLAIEAAARAGLPLDMIIKRAQPDERQYWDQVVAPALTGNEEIYESVGPAEKGKLLGRARALLMPLCWDEPFGLVMVEALACGTPVIARPFGAARDIVEDGVCGFLRSTVDELAAATERVGSLSPATCRMHAAANFGADRMVDGYLRTFEQVLAAQPGSGPGPGHGSDSARPWRVQVPDPVVG